MNETHRWIRLGGLSFQPAELAKLAVILFLAYHLERRGERVNEFLPSLFPALLLLGWFAFLVFIQPDLGSAASLVLTGARDALPGRRAPALLRGPRPAWRFPSSTRRSWPPPTGATGIEAFLNPWSGRRGAPATRSSRA